MTATTPDQPADQKASDHAVAGHDALIAAFDAVLPGNTDLAEDLLRRYAEPHRRYHGVEHLSSVLDWVEKLKVRSSDLFSVKLAVWFHDAVYQLKGAELSNEEASARLANRELSRRGLEQEELGEVSRLVRLTETHHPGPSDKSGELLCDADLAILGAEPEAYARYRDAVRAEYAAVDDHDFAVGRLAVLQHFGGRKIFRTTAGRHLEAAAQANLEAEARALITDYDLPAEGWPIDTDQEKRS